MFLVEIVARAEQQVRRIDAWWRLHRDEVPELFTDELHAATQRLESAPSSGSPYPAAELHGVRRVLLRRTRHHVYYTVDAPGRRVIIRAVWHATRGREPELR